MRTLKLTLAYDGTDYVGWQVQPNGVSIQQKLESAWEQVCQEQLRITASGRTDAGVHARGQVCSLTTETARDNETLCRALNANLPKDIVVLHVDSGVDGFHAIRDAVSKTYRYQIQAGEPPDLFQRRYRWLIRQQLDHDAIRAATRLFLGQHDFASFQASGAETKTTIRTIQRLDWIAAESDRAGEYDLIAQADGFLYNMVRNIVGSLVEIGLGKQPPTWICEVIAAADRRAAGPTAPPFGLFLEQVFYASSDI